jgi:hypothetical protein
LADGAVGIPSTGRDPRTWPWWAQVAAIFVASRVVTTTIMLVFAAAQAAQSGRVGETPNYFDFATIWDGQWYWLIGISGYPAELPRADDGHVTENAWAFMPAYPALLKLLTLGGTLPFPVVAPIVSTLFALAAALAFHRLLRRFLPASTTLFAVVLFCTAPLSPILQVSYAESMHLFLLFLALILLVDRRYALLVPIVLLMSLTRPSGLAFALLLLLHAIHRFVIREREPFPTIERVEVVIAGLASFLAGLAWPIAAWIATGSMSAYTDTELAWRATYIGHEHLVPFVPWFQGAAWWLGWWGVPEPWNWIAGAVVVVGIVGAFAALLLGPWARRLGTDIRFWLVAYALYLLAVFFPQSSTFRLLVPLAPALGALAIPRSVPFRVVLVAGGIVGQVLWIHVAWWVDGRDWTPP